MNWKVNRHPATYGGVKQTYPNVQPGEPFLYRSVVVGNLIFLSAVSAQSIETGNVLSKTLEEQMFAVLDNVRMVMKEAGSSIRASN